MTYFNYYLKDNHCVFGFNLTTITVAEKPNFTVNKGAHTWRSGRASDSELRGPGLGSHRQHRVVSLSKTH